jgi:hypothetical protein
MSAKNVVLFVFDDSGDVAAGLTLSFDVYKDDEGNDIEAPEITEIGSGAYKFTPDFSASSGKGIVYVLDTSGANPKKICQYLRPEDFGVDTLLAAATGKWQIHTTGADANRLVIYDPADGTTPVLKFDLFDRNGLPTAMNPFRRDPV